MTIAELQLARMRPAPLDRHTLAGFYRARRARRFNLMALLAAWTCIWLYGLSGVLTRADLTSSLDRLLPLQVVAGTAALIIFFSGRSLDRGGRLRLLTLVPAAVTVVGALGLVSMLALDARMRSGDHGPAAERVQLVAL